MSRNKVTTHKSENSKCMVVKLSTLVCGMRCSNAFASEVRGAFGVGEVTGKGSLNRPVLGAKVDNPSIIMEDCSRQDVLSLKLFIKNYVASFDRMFF